MLLGGRKHNALEDAGAEWKLKIGWKFVFFQYDVTPAHLKYGRGTRLLKNAYRSGKIVGREIMNRLRLVSFETLLFPSTNSGGSFFPFPIFELF